MQTIRPNDPETLRVLGLVEAAGLREPTELDLLLFFLRHPRVVLSSEQLARYVGHEVPHVARALEVLLGAGLLRRVLCQGAAGRMYVLAADQSAGWLEPVERLCATPNGRRALRATLKARRSQAHEGNGWH